MLVDIFSIIIVAGIIIFLIYSTWELSNSNKIDSNGFAIIDINRYKKSSSRIDDISILEDLFKLIKNISKLTIMAIVVIVALALEIAWLFFLFGSVIGCILMFIFFAEGFLLPLLIMPIFKDLLYKK
jgi:ABC-type multidrug transport system fused ATPase/permease subunit